MINNQLIQELLENNDVSQEIIDSLMIRSDKSQVIKNLFLNLQLTNLTKDSLINSILKSLLEADKLNLIYCNKETLSKITGLTPRIIDDLRRDNKIPCIQISKNNSSKGGRKSIIFDPIEVKYCLNTYKKEIL